MDNNTQSAIEAGTALAKLQLLTEFGEPGVKIPCGVLPPDYEIKVLDKADVEEWRGKPFRKAGNWGFADADSFIRYFNEHKEDASRIFARITDTSAGFEAVLNFHGKEPSFNDHRCYFSLQATREWLVWTTNAGVKMSQAEFALFLEENKDMFKDPAGADLLEIIQNLEGKNNAYVNSAIKLPNGELKLTYNEEITLKGISTTQASEIDLPTVLNVALSPFHGVGVYPLSARLRWRINERKVTFWYEPVNAHLVVRAVALDVCNIIEKQTAVVPFKV